jgi:hypothetical protein
LHLVERETISCLASLFKAPDQAERLRPALHQRKHIHESGMIFALESPVRRLKVQNGALDRVYTPNGGPAAPPADRKLARAMGITPP